MLSHKGIDYEGAVTELQAQESARVREILRQRRRQRDDASQADR